MHSDLIEIGWNEEYWSRICAAISEEAQKARVAAQVLNIVGPLDPTTVAVPPYALSSAKTPSIERAVAAPGQRERRGRWVAAAAHRRRRSVPARG